MMDVQSALLLNGVTVLTTNKRGFTPEELADQAVEKILYVGDNVHPAIKEIHEVLVQYMKQAIKSDRTTLANNLRACGREDLIKLLEI
jgi:hypothetical protein